MLNFKISYGTNGYSSYNLQEAIERISGFGYEGIDLMADRPHAYPPDLNKEDTQTLGKICQNAGLEIVNINASSVSAIYEKGIRKIKEMSLPPALGQFCAMYEPSLVSQNEEVRDKRIRYIKECIDLAHSLGVKNISTFSGIRLPMTPPQEAWAWLAEGLATCLDYAAHKGVRIALEPEPFHLVESIADVSKLLEEIDSRWLRVNFDIGHAYCVEGSTQSVIDAIKKLGDKIVHVHIEDIKGKKHYHRVPGDGDIGEEGLRKILDALAKAGYGGFLTVELYTYSAFPDFAAKQAIGVLRKIINAN